MSLHLFINALAATAGGGLTYVRNVVPKLSAHGDVRATVLLSPRLRRELPDAANVRLTEIRSPASIVRRFSFEQWRLPGLIRDSGADVLLSAGNFALWNSPVPQILLSRNALYTSVDFLHDLKRRHSYTLWADTKVKGALAAASIRRSDVTVAPSDAFAQELSDWTGVRVQRIYHGFDAESFHGKDALSAELAQQLANPDRHLRLLFVSHYNYYRNFETLFRALPLVQKMIPGRRAQLVLTCRLRSEENPGAYRADAAAALVRELGVAEDVIELGAVPYRHLYHVYRSCDVYVTPAYAESFAHPLVEAMSSGLPVVASDLPVHREICGSAALYFSRFSSEELASQVVRVVNNPAQADSMSQLGLTRSKEFSWETHVAQLLKLAERLKHSA